MDVELTVSPTIIQSSNLSIVLVPDKFNIQLFVFVIVSVPDSNIKLSESSIVIPEFCINLPVAPSKRVIALSVLETGPTTSPTLVWIL